MARRDCIRRVGRADPQERTVRWLGLTAERYQPLEMSGLIEPGPAELAERLEWPPPAS